MKPIHLICAFALIVCLPIATYAADAERSMEAAGTSIKLILGPSEIHVGEAVNLGFELHRTGPGTMPIFSAKLELSEGNDIDVFVTAPGEAEVRLQGALEPGVYSGTAIEVPPGRVIDHQIKLLYDNAIPKSYIFEKPGEYTVRASLRFSFSTSPDPKRIAVATRVIVRPPEGEGATEAWKLVDDPQSARALQLGVIPNEEISKKFADVYDRYPHTSYGKSCARAIALHASYKKGGDLREALPILKKYEKTYRTDPDTDLIVYTIIGAYHVLGNYDLARDWMYYMTDQFPSSSLLRAQDPLYKFYFYDPAEQVFTFPWYLFDKPWIVPGEKPPTDLKVLQQ